MSTITITTDGAQASILMNGIEISNTVSEYTIVHKAGELPVINLKITGVDMSVNGVMIPELPDIYKGYYVPIDALK